MEARYIKSLEIVKLRVEDGASLATADFEANAKERVRGAVMNAQVGPGSPCALVFTSCASAKRIIYYHIYRLLACEELPETFLFLFSPISPSEGSKRKVVLGPRTLQFEHLLKRLHHERHGLSVCALK